VPSLQPLFDDPTLDEDELSRELRSRAVEYAVDHPSYVARVVFWNTMHLFGFSGRDFAHVTGASLGYSARLSDAGLVGWYAVAALAAVGLVSAPWRRTPLALWSVPVLFAATTVTALGTYRYRAPLEPFALCLAAVALCAIADRVRRRLLPDVVRDVTPPGPSAFRRFGNGSVIVPPTRVNSPEYIEIGDGVVMLEHGWLSVRAEHGPGRPPRLVVGDRVRFGRAVSIACIGEVVIEDDVMTSDGVFIGDCFHEYADPHTPVIDQPMSIPEPVRIERGAYLGAGSIVLPGVTVGAGAYVGEGAVVTRDVAPRTVVLGNPARVVERYP
jgi:hypothetical protein